MVPLEYHLLYVQLKTNLRKGRLNRDLLYSKLLMLAVPKRSMNNILVVLTENEYLRNFA